EWLLARACWANATTASTIRWPTTCAPRARSKGSRSGVSAMPSTTPRRSGLSWPPPTATTGRCRRATWPPCWPRSAQRSMRPVVRCPCATRRRWSRLVPAAPERSRASGRLGLLGQAEGPFAHDVALDLGRAAPDGLRAREEEERLQIADGVAGLGPAGARQQRVLALLAGVALEDLPV